MEKDTSDRVLAVIEREVGPVASPSVTFDELNLDSLELLNLLQCVENETGHKFPDEAIAEMNSVQDILNATALPN